MTPPKGNGMLMFECEAHVVAAVQQIIVAVDLSARNRHAHRVHIIMRGHHAAGCVRRHGSATRKQNQIRRLPAVQRKIHNALVIDNFRKKNRCPESQPGGCIC